MSNSIPQGWIKADLEFFSEINPRLTKKSELENETLVSFIKMEDVSNSAKVLNKSIRKYSEVSKGYTSFEDNDVLVAKITPCFENGKGGYAVNLKNGVGFGSTEFHVLRAKGSADSKFLYHFTNSKSFRLEAESNMTGSAGQRRVPTDFLKSYEAIFPQFSEQQKIAAILTSVDEVIETTQAQITKLEDLKTGMMMELLTKGIGHTEFKDSAIGLIPKAWRVVEFKDIFNDYKYGPRFSSKDYDSNGNVKTIRGTDVTQSGSIRYQQVPTAKIDKNTVDAHALKDGDLVMITTADCGLTAVFREQNIPFIASAYAIKLTPTNAVDSQFVLYFMQTSNAKKQVDSFVRKGTVANLPGSDVMTLKIGLPPLDEQKKIVSTLQSLDTEIELKNKVLVSKNALKKALMQDLLTGKVRVKVSSS